MLLGTGDWQEPVQASAERNWYEVHVSSLDRVYSLRKSRQNATSNQNRPEDDSDRRITFRIAIHAHHELEPSFIMIRPFLAACWDRLGLFLPPLLCLEHRISPCCCLRFSDSILADKFLNVKLWLIHKMIHVRENNKHRFFLIIGNLQHKISVPYENFRS